MVCTVHPGTVRRSLLGILVACAFSACTSGTSTSASNASQITGFQPTQTSGASSETAASDTESMQTSDATASDTGAGPTTDDPSETTTMGSASSGETDTEDPTDATVSETDATTGPPPACAMALAAASDDLESVGGWTHDVMDGVSANWTFDHWEHGIPSSGPGACFDGGSCWATNLDDNYVSCQRAYLQSPTYDLSACANEPEVFLVVRHAYDFWSGEWNGQMWFDGGLIEFSPDGGANWQAAPGVAYPGTIAINPNMGLLYECVDSNGFYVHQRPGFIGTNDGWEELAIAVPPDLRTSQVAIRFAYASGVSYQTSNEQTTMQYTRPGWFLDAPEWATSYP